MTLMRLVYVLAVVLVLILLIAVFGDAHHQPFTYGTFR